MHEFRNGEVNLGQHLVWPSQRWAEERMLGLVLPLHAISDDPNLDCVCKLAMKIPIGKQSNVDCYIHIIHGGKRQQRRIRNKIELTIFFCHPE